MKFYVRTTLERTLDSSYNQIEYTLLVDNEHKPVESFFRQIDQISNEDAVLLEDDLVLCDNFKQLIEGSIAKHPNDIINFFQDPYDYYSAHYTQKFAWNQCTYYPKGSGKKIADFIKDYFVRVPSSKRLQYDVLEGIAIRGLNMLVWTERPILVQHIDSKECETLIQPGKIHERRTPFFIDYLKELNISYDEAYLKDNLKTLNHMRIAHFRKNSK